MLCDCVWGFPVQQNTSSSSYQVLGQSTCWPWFHGCQPLKSQVLQYLHAPSPIQIPSVRQLIVIEVRQLLPGRCPHHRDFTGLEEEFYTKTSSATQIEMVRSCCHPKISHRWHIEQDGTRDFTVDEMFVDNLLQPLALCPNWSTATSRRRIESDHRSNHRCLKLGRVLCWIPVRSPPCRPRKDYTFVNAPARDLRCIRVEMARVCRLGQGKRKITREEDEIC